MVGGGEGVSKTFCKYLAYETQKIVVKQRQWWNVRTKLFCLPWTIVVTPSPIAVAIIANVLLLYM